MSNVRDRVASQAVAVQSGSDQPTIYDIVNRQRDQVALALPTGMDPDRFTRLVITQIRQTPKLAQCTPASLLGALMLSAQLGLEPGPLGHVWLIPRSNHGTQEVQFMLGYKGIIELARRSGQLSSIEAHAVHELDDFDFAYGLEPTLVHKPVIRGERGEAYAYYAVAKFKDGGQAFVVLSKEQVILRARRGSAWNASTSPWKTDFDAMACKTCIRALAPYLPLSAELDRAIRGDERVYTTLAPNMLDETPPAIEAGTVDTETGEILDGDGAAEDATTEGELL